jgi:hypothetical protein
MEKLAKETTKMTEERALEGVDRSLVHPAMRKRLVETALQRDEIKVLQMLSSIEHADEAKHAAIVEMVRNSDLRAALFNAILGDLSDAPVVKPFFKP